MELNMAQTKLVGLTMELDLKAREYNMLCEKLEKYNEEHLDENDEKYYELLNEFKKNQDEIEEIKRQIKELENFEEPKIKSDLFNKKEETANERTAIVEPKDESFIKKLMSKIKSIFAKKRY